MKSQFLLSNRSLSRFFNEINVDLKKKCPFQKINVHLKNKCGFEKINVDLKKQMLI